MKKLFLGVVVTFLLIVPLALGSAFAGPSSKFAAQVKDITIFQQQEADDCSAGIWRDALNTSIKTPNKHDLLIGASFVTSLYTQTEVKGKNGQKDSADAMGMLKMRVLIDNNPNIAQPSEVVYDRRFQKLTAVLGGVIESCEDTGTFTVDPATDLCEETVDPATGDSIPDGVLTVQCECVVTDEEIELILDTMSAHHFNFVAANLTPGDHPVKVQVCIETDANWGNGSASALAGVGQGSLTVEQVRATNSPDGIEFVE